MATYTYDSSDRLTKEVKGNITTEYTYNLAGLVTNMTNKNGSTVLSKYDYTYNYDGNVATKSVNGQTTSYTYDPMNRLISEVEPANEYIYSYDVEGNRSKVVAEIYYGDSYTTTYDYDQNNRLISQVKNTGAQKYCTDYYYDNNGNTLTKIHSEFNQSSNGKPALGIKTASELSKDQGYEYFTYDVFNQLVGYKNSNGITASYFLYAEWLQKV